MLQIVDNLARRSYIEHSDSDKKVDTPCRDPSWDPEVEAEKGKERKKRSKAGNFAGVASQLKEHLIHIYQTPFQKRQRKEKQPSGWIPQCFLYNPEVHQPCTKGLIWF